MALTLKDRVQETCNSPGTGTVTLLGAVTGYQTFSAGVGNANTCYYTIADQGGANWEVGIGTYTSSGNTLARTTVISSSNGGSLTNFSSGVQSVFVTYPAEKAVYQDASGNVTLPAALTAAGLVQGAETYASNGVVLNNATVSTSFTFPTGANGSSVGPVTVASGVTVTVPSGNRWLVF